MTESRLFIAYAREDDAVFVERLDQDLKVRGYQTTDAEPLMTMDYAELTDQLRKIIIETDQLILVIGPQARTSPIVRLAWTYAWQYCKSIIPILRIDANLQLPPTLQGVDYVDFRNNRRYEFARDELIAILETPVARVGELHDVPALPKYYLEREDALDTVKESLFTDSVPVTITNAQGGSGKSILAAAIARDCEVRQASVDGVFWVRFGENPNLPLLQSHLIQLLTNTDITPCIDTEMGKQAVEEAFRGRSCLVVLDDVRSVEDFNTFAVFGTQTGVLITTPNQELSNQINSADYNLPAFNDEEAARLMALVSGQKLKTLPPMTLDIIRACEGNPMALTIVGATLRGKPNGWGTALHRLRQTNEEDQVVARAIQTSLDTPASEGTTKIGYKILYSDLVIFPAYAQVNDALLRRLWAENTDEVLAKLTEKHLVERDSEGNFAIHRLQHDFLQETVKDAQPVHQRFLDSYSTTDWAKVDDDGYIVAHLPFHIAGAGRVKTLHKLLLDFNWIHNKLNATNINVLLSDFDFALAQSIKGTIGSIAIYDDLKMLRDALGLSAEVLAHDKSQLSSQIIGRLLDYESEIIQQLVAQAIGSKSGIWLRPVTNSLQRPRTLGRSSLNVTASFFNQSLAITPDGKRALVGSRRNTIQIWNLETGAREKTLSGHSGAIWALAVFPDNKRFVSASDDYTVNVWDIESGEILRTLRGHTGPVWAVAVMPDGKHVLSGSADTNIKMWDAETGNVVRTLSGHTEEIADIAVSGDGTYIVSGSYDNTIRIWFADGSIWKTLRGHTRQVNAVMVTPNNQFIVSASRDRTIRLWNISTGTESARMSGHTETIRSIDMTKDGKWLVSASRDRSIKVWDLVSRREHATIAENLSSVMAVAIVGDQVLMASAEMPLKMWEILSGSETLSLEAHTQRIDSMKALPDKPQVITGSYDQTIKLWHVETGAVLRTFREHRAGVDSIALTDNGQYVVSGSWDNTLNVYSLDDGVLVHTLKAHIEGITATATTLDRQFVIAASVDNMVTVWDLASGNKLHTLKGHEAPITALAVTADSKCVVSASLDKKLVLWDIISGNQRHQFDGHGDGVTDVAITGNYVLSSSRDHSILLWDIQTGRVVRHFGGHKGWVNSLALTNDGFITASDDGTIKIWHLEKDTPLRSLEGHTHWVWDIALAGDYLFSVSSDKTLRMWKLEDGENIATFTSDSPLISCTLSSDGKTIIAGSQAGQLHLLRIEGVKT